jgi:hypothetical protein
MKETKINFELVGEKKRTREKKKKERQERKTMTERVQYVLLKKKKEPFIHTSISNE